MIKVFADIYCHFNLSYNEILSEIYFVLDILFGLTKQDVLRGKTLSDKDFIKTKKIFQKRVETGLPIQYIVGKTFFMNDVFYVNDNVLIPRDDTQILVNRAIKIIKNNKIDKVLDVGTGSGIIAIELAKNTSSNIFASDISDDAINIATKNANLHNTNITFIKSDLFSDIGEKFDFIVSNPPYIPLKEKETIQNEVKFEPDNALYAKNNGLYFYEKIIEQSVRFLTPKGFLAFEIGINQAEIISKLLQKEFKNILIEEDVSGIERVISAQLKS